MAAKNRRDLVENRQDQGEDRDGELEQAADPGGVEQREQYIYNFGIADLRDTQSRVPRIEFLALPEKHTRYSDTDYPYKDCCHYSLH